MLLQDFGKEKVLVHSGMLASADWLYDRMYCVALVSFTGCHQCSPAFDPKAVALAHDRTLQGLLLPSMPVLVPETGFGLLQHRPTPSLK